MQYTYNVLFNEQIHRLFRLPYKLTITGDTQKGRPVIFLHGIASNSATWKFVLPILPKKYRAITIDLLGFGTSAKPKYTQYTIADHTSAVVRTIRSIHCDKPVILVGHSMGALIAIDIAKKYPRLVSSLVLVSAPLYNTLDVKAAGEANAEEQGKTASNLFFIYHKLIANQSFTLKAAQAIMKVAPSSNSFFLTLDTWLPFQHSLTNTIMSQTTLNDLRGLQLPIYMLYGKLDLLLQQKNYTLLEKEGRKNITIIPYTGAHMITKSGAQSVVQAINAAALKNNTHRKIAAKTER